MSPLQSPLQSHHSRITTSRVTTPESPLRSHHFRVTTPESPLWSHHSRASIQPPVVTLATLAQSYLSKVTTPESRLHKLVSENYYSSPYSKVQYCSRVSATVLQLLLLCHCSSATSPVLSFWSSLPLCSGAASGVITQELITTPDLALQRPLQSYCSDATAGVITQELITTPDLALQ